MADDIDTEREFLAEAKLRPSRGEPHDRFLDSYRARMGYRTEILRPPAIHGVEGTIDIHTHAHEGQQDALAIAQLASASGMRGLLLKSVTGMNRADIPGPGAVVRKVTESLRRWGDSAGIEPATLWWGWLTTDTRGLTIPEAARGQLDDGASAVWMPVFRSANTLSKVGGMPAWWGESPDAGWSDPLPWDKALKAGAYTLDEHGRLKREYREVLRMVADYDVMVSFGHATHREIDAMAEEVQRLGITKAVVDHPFSPFLDLSLDQMRALAGAGICLNFTYDEISPLLGVNPALMCQTIQALGAEHVTLSSDAGEPLFPNTVEALRILLAHMSAFGLSDDELRQASVLNPARLVGAAVPGADGSSAS